jgi:hypothetical protein
VGASLGAFLKNVGVDVRHDCSGCDTVWINPVPSGAVPKLSIREGNIYTVKRTVTDSTPQYFYVAIDFRGGRTLSEKLTGSSYALDTLQPTISGIIQVRPGAATQKVNR